MLRESNATRLVSAIEQSTVRLISTGTVLEASLVLLGRFGGGGRHRTALNYGNCFGYALAVSQGEPLLFVGEDFAQTDVVPVRW